MVSNRLEDGFPARINRGFQKNFGHSVFSTGQLSLHIVNTHLSNIVNTYLSSLVNMYSAPPLSAVLRMCPCEEEWIEKQVKSLIEH